MCNLINTYIHTHARARAHLLSRLMRGFRIQYHYNPKTVSDCVVYGKLQLLFNTKKFIYSKKVENND